MIPYSIDIFSAASLPSLLVGGLAIFLPLAILGIVCLKATDYKQEMLGWVALLACLAAGSIGAIAVAKPMIEAEHNEQRITDFISQANNHYGVELTVEQATVLNPPFWPLGTEEQTTILGGGVEILYHGSIVAVYLGWDGEQMQLIDELGNPLSIDSLDTEANLGQVIEIDSETPPIVDNPTTTEDFSSDN